MKKEVEDPARASPVGGDEIPIQNGATEVEKRWLSLVSEKADHKTCTWSIQKVPRIFRQVEANKKEYDPLVVSIGPYHRGKPELQFMENHKCRMACQFADNDQLKLQQLYTKVKNVAKHARTFYKDDHEQSVSKLDDREFTQMMFLDGCFVLHFIQRSPGHNLRDLDVKPNIAACVRRDLLLLENQLPFLILNELTSTVELKGMLNKFFENITGPPQNDNPKKTTDIEKGSHQKEADPSHLLDYIRIQLVDQNALTTENVDQWSSYRSAKELKAVGINIKPGETSKFTVKFDRGIFTDELTLPPITVDDSTKSMLLNMVAYEACPGVREDLGVTSYICFLDSLIDHADDVKELRSNRILLNFLGNDQQVADLFNQIADNLVPNPRAYAKVKSEIEKHYNNMIKKWLAEFWHTHFTSPWTLLAFLGAILALVLSVIQTYKSIYPGDNNTQDEPLH